MFLIGRVILQGRYRLSDLNREMLDKERMKKLEGNSERKVEVWKKDNTLKPLSPGSPGEPDSPCKKIQIIKT